MPDKIKVLFLAANPFRDRAKLELEAEMRAIRHALKRGKAHDALELEAHFGARPRDLQLILREYQPDIVHFSGHGDRDGVLYLGDAAGNPTAVGKAALGKLFDLLDSGVRVVVLNACHTHSIVEVLRDVVDYAIGTNHAISDDAAVTFSQAFYTALASGAGVQLAFDLAVNQLELDGSDLSVVPVLRKRFGADRRPLLARAAPAAGGGGAAEVRQHAHTEHVTGSRMEMVGHDHQGASGVHAGPVHQDLTAKDVDRSTISMFGTRTGGA